MDALAVNTVVNNYKNGLETFENASLELIALGCSADEVVKLLSPEPVVIPDEVLPAEEAPKLTAQQIKAINVQGSGAVFHRATPQHNLGKKSSNNSSKKVSKKAEKTAKESRKKNRKIANKKFRPSGSKKRK